MKIPRDVSGAELAKNLKRLGYTVVRRAGTHMTATTSLKGEHHVTVPNHRAIKLGTLKGILKAVANHHRLSVDELLTLLDL